MYRVRDAPDRIGGPRSIERLGWYGAGVRLCLAASPSRFAVIGGEALANLSGPQLTLAGEQRVGFGRESFGEFLSRGNPLLGNQTTSAGTARWSEVRRAGRVMSRGSAGLFGAAGSRRETALCFGSCSGSRFELASEPGGNRRTARWDWSDGRGFCDRSGPAGLCRYLVQKVTYGDCSGPD